MLHELLSTVCHLIEHYADNPIAADRSRWKAQLRPMRGLKALRWARVVSAVHAFTQNLRGHYELVPMSTSVSAPVVFTDLVLTI